MLVSCSLGLVLHSLQCICSIATLMSIGASFRHAQTGTLSEAYDAYDSSLVFGSRTTIYTLVLAYTTLMFSLSQIVERKRVASGVSSSSHVVARAEALLAVLLLLAGIILVTSHPTKDCDTYNYAFNCTSLTIGIVSIFLNFMILAALALVGLCYPSQVTVDPQAISYGVNATPKAVSTINMSGESPLTKV